MDNKIHFITERRGHFRALRLMRGKTQLAAVLFDRNECGSPGWASRFLWRSGAGYRGCFSAYLAWRSGSNRWAVQYRGARKRLLEVGITRNANKVPYTSH